MASSDDRIHLLNKCIACIKGSRYKDADFYLFYQGSRFDEVKDSDIFKEVLFDSKLRGIFTPRFELMEKFCIDYDFTILIDDDLFLYPTTSYETAMWFLDMNQKAGAVSIVTHKKKTRKEITKVKETDYNFNVDGGMVFPNRAIRVIVDYFKDKKDDYTEDMFWLLLYVKGFDLFRDWTSQAEHNFNEFSVDNSELTGFSKMRVEKEYKPILTEYFDTPSMCYRKEYGKSVRSIKTLRNLNDAGREERTKNYGKAED